MSKCCISVCLSVIFLKRALKWTSSEFERALVRKRELKRDQEILRELKIRELIIEFKRVQDTSRELKRPQESSGDFKGAQESFLERVCDTNAIYYIAA